MSFDAILPYQPTPLPSAVVGGTVTLTFRLLGKTLNECFPQDLFAYGVWTQNDGTKISVQHVKIVTVNPGDCTLVASGVVNNSGFMETWYEYTHTIDTGTLTNPIGSGAWATGYYSLCYGRNGKHDGIPFHEPNIYAAWGFTGDYYRNAFILTPEPLEIDDGPTDRSDVHSRVAGERAIYEDEFITKDQIEAGHGIAIRYRDETGTMVPGLTGTDVYYPTSAAKRMDIVIECLIYWGGSWVRTKPNNFNPEDTNLTDGYWNNIQYIEFATDSDYNYDNTLSVGNGHGVKFTGEEIDDGHSWPASVPIIHTVTNRGDGSLVVTSRTAHNNFFLGKIDETLTTATWEGTFDGAEYFDTVQAILFADTPFITWSINPAGAVGVLPNGNKKNVMIVNPLLDLPPSHWYLGINTDTIVSGAVAVYPTELVRIIAGTNVTVTKVDQDITINATGGTGSSSWNLGIGEDPAQNIADTDTIRLIAGPDMIIKRIY